MKRYVDATLRKAGSRKLRLHRTRPPLRTSQQFSFHDVTIDVFLAKDFLNGTWVHQGLKNTVFRCRKTFSRYGNVSTILDYDEKSAVYLGRATYVIDGKTICEWLSFRLVPALGEPLLTEDLQVCEVGGKDLLDVLIEQQVVDNNREPLSQILSLSRLCGIHPYAEIGENPARLPTKLQYGALLFACMHSFLSDRKHLGSLKPAVITALFHKPFLNSFMAHKTASRIEIPTAHDVLGETLRDPSVGLKRDEKVYSYPGYFFQIHQLLNALTSLIDSQRLRDSTIMYHAKLDAPLREIRERSPHISTLLEQLEHLSQLTNCEGLLHESNMTGRELRDYIDLHVADGPTLHLLSIDGWKKEVSRFISSII